MERIEILDLLLETSSSHTYHNEPHRESIHESPSTAKSEPSSSTFQDFSVESSPEPRTPKEEEIQPSMFASPFKDNRQQNPRNTCNDRYEKEPTVPHLPSSNSILNMFTKEELSKELRRTSEAIRASSSSPTISCAMRGTTVEALHDPSAEACIITENRMETLVGRKPLIPSDKLLLSNRYGYFECRGIARDVLIIIDEIEVSLDFYIFPIMDFGLLIGYPLEKILLHRKSSQGSLNDDLEKTAATIPIPVPEQHM